MKKRWFDKLIGCSFYLFDDMTGGKSGEYIFVARAKIQITIIKETRCNMNSMRTVNPKYY